MSAIRVLLIEDDEQEAREIKAMLLDGKASHFDLAVVATLTQGLQLGQQASFDVILLELPLPDSEHTETLLTVRSAMPDAAIIALTGAAHETELGVLAMQSGVQDYLSKDELDAKLLRRSIRYAIERFDIRRQLEQSEQEYRSLIDDVFDTSMVAVLILDRDFHVVWCNAATSIYFGLEREVILGRDNRELIESDLKCIFADPDDYANRLLRAYEISDFTQRFECQVLPEGERQMRWLEHWSQPIRGGMYRGGRIEQYTDITDRKMLESAERQQREYAEALRDIAILLTSSLDLDEVLGRILSSLYQVVRHDSAAITLIEAINVNIIINVDADTDVNRDTDKNTDKNTNELFRVVRSKRDATQQTIVTEDSQQVDYSPYAQIMQQTRQPLVVADMLKDERLQGSEAISNYRAYVGAPIRLQKATIGFVHLLSQTPTYFNPTHAQRLSSFAGLAAIAIQNAQLFEQSQQFATAEERRRLARDLHDSVSQTLFSARTMSETALRQLDSNPTQAREFIAFVHHLTINALSELRILMLELRPQALTRISLQELFEQYLAPTQAPRQHELVLSLDETIKLPPDVQIAFYRITQEALNNINKHAQARRVTVRVQQQEQATGPQITLEIQDDGVGFDLVAAAPTSLGLGIMRERAEQINATLEIQSAPGQGTTVRLRWQQQAASSDASGTRADTTAHSTHDEEDRMHDA